MELMKERTANIWGKHEENGTKFIKIRFEIINNAVGVKLKH